MVGSFKRQLKINISHQRRNIPQQLQTNYLTKTTTTTTNYQLKNQQKYNQTTLKNPGKKDGRSKTIPVEQFLTNNRSKTIETYRKKHIKIVYKQSNFL